MYSKEETTKLQNSSNFLLKELERGISENKIESLRNVLRFHEYRYYILNDPLISDYEYDQLFKSLEKIEIKNPKLITGDSPTQRVAKGLTKVFPTVQHLVPMYHLIILTIVKTWLISTERQGKRPGSTRSSIA